MVEELGDDLPRVHADPMRIKQVLMNLVSNAVKFSEHEGEITVSVTASGEELTVKVTDKGAGISEDVLPCLFDKFYRAPQSSQGGTGLGLYIARQVVEGHSGTIWAESRPGMGSIFSFTLPIGDRPKDSEVGRAEDQEV